MIYHYIGTPSSHSAELPRYKERKKQIRFRLYIRLDYCTQLGIKKACFRGDVGQVPYIRPALIGECLPFRPFLGLLNPNRRITVLSFLFSLFFLIHYSWLQIQRSGIVFGWTPKVRSGKTKRHPVQSTLQSTEWPKYVTVYIDIDM